MYVPSVFPIEYKRKPCIPRHVLNRDSHKAFHCSTVDTDEEEKMCEVEPDILRKQAYLRKGDILFIILKSKYRILQGTLPISILKHKNDSVISNIDKTVTVCAVLTNLCKSTVPI